MRIRNKLKALLLLFALVVPTLGLSACNTVRGFGEDIGAAGRGIERGAERVKPY